MRLDIKVLYEALTDEEQGELLQVLADPKVDIRPDVGPDYRVPYMVLDELFNWGHTEQGWDYWSEISNKLMSPISKLRGVLLPEEQVELDQILADDSVTKGFPNSEEPKYILLDGFAWAVTKQGGEYWGKVYLRLKENK